MGHPAARVEKDSHLFSDDECIQKLTLLMRHRNNRNLNEIVALIGRLAAPIQL
ncbi:hypothetical protein [Tardiphaga sp.]|jgi:hypothetical protein|uniref:hypothetical protein n=1 Tax=Tardiphaga sp. TaxID=1926292 RepID=UPI0019A98E76|nr:hypothetical protein [Tardiphaga sp.]MBC7577376.1 hypothetical protein [Tardiphaga sp.]